MAVRAITALLLALGCLAGSARAGDPVWLETERFDDRGGWTNDAQFIDQIGSPYLMAIGLGEPVEDAVTTFTLPGPGRYRLWARTKDWVPEHHPGRFRILLNGRPVDPLFGESGQTGWQWEDGGVHELTGYYGRCDVIVLSDDPQWIPPADREALAAFRERFGGVSREVDQMGPYDVVVVGGGLARSPPAP